MKTRDGLQWIGANRRTIFNSLDFYVALGAFVITLSILLASPTTADHGLEILLIEAGVGIALLGVILAALSILIGPMGEEYLMVLEKMPGGVPGAFLPYQVVAAVAGVGSILGFLSAALWNVHIGFPGSPRITRALSLATVSAAVVWAIVGTMQLVNLTVLHGTGRANLLRGIREARRRGKSA